MRQRHPSVSRSALVTGACVASGFVVASVALPPLETPVSVAHDYLEAEYERDWQNAWALMCRDARNNFGDLPEFSQRLTEIRERYPSEVQVEISGVRSRTDRADPGVNVAYTITSSERRHQNWADRWDIDVVRENGQFRVCYGGG